MYSVKALRHHQSGVTLIISLVLLLLLTLIAVSAMKTTNMQEKMAGNDRDRSLAFQAAESALRAGVTQLETLRKANTSIRAFCNGSPNAAAAPITGLFHQVQADNRTSVDTDLDAFCQACTADCPVPDIYTATTWTNANSIVFNAGLPVTNQPRYFITYVETHVNPKTEPNRYFPPIYTFIITARGTGIQDGSEVILHTYVGGSTDFNP